MVKDSMTGRELVTKAVLFDKPQRIPRNLPDHWGSDIRSVGVDEDKKFKTGVDGEDEWGCIWCKTEDDKTSGQVKIHPLSSYENLSSCIFPDFTPDYRYETAIDTIKNNREQKFILGGLPVALNHRLEYLRGPLNALTDPYDYPDELEILLDKLADINIQVIEKYAQIGGVDGVFWCDDWGLQDRLFISPDVFRHFFKPRYERIFKRAKECSMLAFLHSCGNILDILDDFIEAGLNVIQMDQQENMGLDVLSQRFGGRLCFWCPVDIQKTMVTGTNDDIRKYAREMIDKLGGYNGGFIAQWYAAPQAVGHSQEKIDAMCQEFVEYGGSFYEKFM